MSCFTNNENNELEDPNFPYLPPAMCCQPIVEFSSIVMHNGLNNPLLIPGLSGFDISGFGIAQINIRGEIPLSQKHLHIVFMIDMSCSMSEHGSCSNTKMKDIVNTMENLLRLLWNVRDETNISIHIAAFDTEVFAIFDGHMKTMNLEKAIQKVKKIKPRGSTDIGIGLDHVAEEISNMQILNPEWDVANIFMTDGEITCGIDDKDILKQKLNTKATNIFIGYGKEHDATLLSYLGGENYRFVDTTEKAGLVYGEIVHSLLYKAIKDCVLVSLSDSVEIYDYLHNKWAKSLRIGDLLAEQKKVYHIRVIGHDLDKLTEKDFQVHLEGTTIVQTRQFQQFSGAREFQANLRFIPSICKRDLTPYLFRQRTQELLYKSNQFANELNKTLFDLDEYDKRNEAIDILKAELKDFHEQMTAWAKDNGKEDDPLIKNLADDIYVANRTVGTQYGMMFTCARQVSQGQQHVYSCRSVPEDEFTQTPETTIDSWKPDQDDFASPYVTRTATKLMKECSQP